MAEEGIEEEGTGDTRSAPAREVFQRRSIFLGFLTFSFFLFFKSFTISSSRFTQVCYALGALSLFITFGGILPFSLPNISKGNRAEWSPIRSVIIRVINKIGQPRSGRLIMITGLNWTTRSPITS